MKKLHGGSFFEGSIRISSQMKIFLKLESCLMKRAAYRGCLGFICSAWKLGFVLNFNTCFEWHNKQYLLTGIANATKEEESNSGLSAVRNVGSSTKDGILGTTSAPIHMVTAEGRHFKDQLWRTFRSIALAFLLISGVGALIEDRGIGRGTTLYLVFT